MASRRPVNDMGISDLHKLLENLRLRELNLLQRELLIWGRLVRISRTRHHAEAVLRKREGK